MMNEKTLETIIEKTISEADAANKCNDKTGFRIMQYEV